MAEELVDKECIFCGAWFQVMVRNAGQAKYCEKCKSKGATLRRERHRLKHMASTTVRQGYTSVGEYKIVKDPDETWGYNSCLNEVEIRTLNSYGHLSVGTIFEHRRTGEQLVVKRTESGFELKEWVE